ncbi:hypothetical protein CkaCkLH20_09377 [Colletotrichum karsti]|uniref:Uncharacterized protein n=1 Tax=Colletotrichum karsti TaxID=1095194 RepID=A0A9P6HZ14_9PEZI|nr:uncharacterized protein CkaCkLH20_09377 [Colletotrichum karsti]KAF9873214.1 hypothetical protein CkaCkLH20_09377 [Colletotrichum karsti]
MRYANFLSSSTLLAAISWSAIVTLTTAQSSNFDLGNLDLYQGTDGNVPSLEGDSLWMTGAEDSGFHLVLSADLQKKVQKGLDDCGDVKDECFQKLHRIISSSTTHIDNALEKRHFGHLLSKTFKKVGVMFTVISSILLWSWEEKHTPPSPVWFIPQEKASLASNVASPGTIVMSGGGAPIMTITPPPDTPSATGSITPEVTFVATASAGLKEGDRIVNMDVDFAKRFQDLLHIFSGDGACKEGQGFVADQTSGQQASPRSGGWDAAICAGLGVMPQVLDNGPLGDLRAMAPPQPPIQFDLAQAAGRAAQIVIEAARDYAPLLNIPAELADEYGVIIFAMAINALVENIDLGSSNTIRAASLVSKTQGPSATPTPTCTGARSCKAFCGEVGAIEQCVTECSTVTSVCATSTTGNRVIVTETTSTFAWPTVPVSQPTATCESSDSGLQWDIFYGKKYNVVQKFCQAVSDDQQAAHAWVVDEFGNETSSKSRKRSPPVTPKTYKDYRIGLEWKPDSSLSEDPCPRSCTEAYEAIANGPCGQNGRQGLTLAMSGSWNIGCGTYSWNVKPPSKKEPTARLEVGEVTCNDQTQFGAYKDVHEGDVQWAAIGLCARERNTELGPGEQYPADKKAANINGHWRQSELHAWVKWREGCVTTVNTQKVGNPLNTVTDGTVTGQDPCITTLFNNYKKCTGNKGAGGQTDIGCLTYFLGPGHV